jgi:phage-related minor tail protein
MPDSLDINSAIASGNDLNNVLGKMALSIAALTAGAGGFAAAMTGAFNQATLGGKQLDDVMRNLALRVSSLSVNAAFKSMAGALTTNLSQLATSLFGRGPAPMAMGGIKPFATGGVVGTPTYFPLSTGGLGLAGEAGPEAIVPLSRGPDGRLGISMNGGAQPASVTVQIATPDAESFRRSEAYITGQIARAVARGQRGL